MVLSGVVFVFFENFWVLLIAAVVGIIAATGSDLGPFRAIEESTISQLTTAKTRSDVLSWYVTVSSLGSAVGTEFSGRAVDFLQSLDGWFLNDVYHAMFWLYVAVGIMNIILTLLMSAKCELAETYKETTVSERLLDEQQVSELADDGSDDNRNSNMAATHKLETTQKKSLFAQISLETRTIIYKLWFLFGVDSLADGMVSLPFTYYYIDIYQSQPLETLLQRAISLLPAPRSLPAPLLDGLVLSTPWYSLIFRPPQLFFSFLFLRESL